MANGPQEILEPTSSLVTREEAIADYRICYRSRQASIIGRREVLTGKAKFGIFGDGKELPQIAMAKVFKPGDIRSGYYRDQTFAFATGLSTIKQFFAQLYADPDLAADPFSGGRQMNSHFASRLIDEAGNWKKLTDMPISSADASPTASQMPRMVGLVQASRQYRLRTDLDPEDRFSRQGNEVVFGTIGNASCAEGQFWESINAIGVIQGPLVMSIWDDEYGISVPNEYQITKSSLSEMLSGFQRSEEERGYEIFTVKAWDYEGLHKIYRRATELARTHHVPCIIHVVEVTQPQGHSTSGSHERYKTPERLAWEVEHDCLPRMRSYLLEQEFATEAEIEAWEKEDRKQVRMEKNEAWQHFQVPIKQELNEFATITAQIASQSQQKEALQAIVTQLKKNLEPARREIMAAAHQVLVKLRGESHPHIERLKQWRAEKMEQGDVRYDQHLYSETSLSPLQVEAIPAQYEEEAPLLSGYEILNQAFDHMLARDPRIVAFGEDVGQLGDVNQGFAGLQAKYGEVRVSDTGIRENTIMGQAIGLAMRGLRPIAEIQYLDYLIYGLQSMSDDLATLRYRTHGGQIAPAIIRTRGHRLEGIWHAGSPMGMIVHAVRGIHVLVPRNMTQAVGFYHTLVQGDDPALVVEVLNGYRLKERRPANLHEFTLPLGVPEVLRTGSDLTLVTYGACCRIALEATELLSEVGISVEVVDVQSLLPFDRPQLILRSLQKTNRLLVVDEDVPGGASAYILQQILEKQGAYYHLDSEPQTLTAKAHRPAYGDDGDYWSKPNAESIFEAVYLLMHEADPGQFPIFW